MNVHIYTLSCHGGGLGEGRPETLLMYFKDEDIRDVTQIKSSAILWLTPVVHGKGLISAVPEMRFEIAPSLLTQHHKDSL